MDLTRLGVAWATTANIPSPEAFAIGSLTARTASPQSAPDLGLSLIETLAYIADVLSAAQEQVADETFLETSCEVDEDVVRVRLLNDLLPAALAVVSDERAFVVVIGSEAGDSTVRFGDDERGERPPEGLEDVIASYRHGGGRVGCVELRGLHLGRRFAAIAINHGATRSLSYSIHR
jgi:hypothetical protein